MDKILDRDTSAVVPFGALSGIRTLDLLIKSQLLLPTELKAHMEPRPGLEPRTEDYKSTVLPIKLPGHAAYSRY